MHLLLNKAVEMYILPSNSGEGPLFWICLISSLIFTAFGQPAWIPECGIIAAAIGFALFWRALLLVPEARFRFFLSMGWFFCVQAIQLSSMTSTQYLGPFFFVCVCGSRCAIWPSFSFPRAGRTSSLVESVQFGQLLGCLGMDASFFSHWIYLESRGSRLEQYRSVAAICLYLGDLRTFVLGCSRQSHCFKSFAF